MNMDISNHPGSPARSDKMQSDCMDVSNHTGTSDSDNKLPPEHEMNLTRSPDRNRNVTLVEASQVTPNQLLDGAAKKRQRSDVASFSEDAPPINQAPVLPPPPKPVLPNPPPECEVFKKTDVLLSGHSRYRTMAHGLYASEVSTNRKRVSADTLKSKLHQKLKQKDPNAPSPTFWIEWSSATKKLGLKNDQTTPLNHFDGKPGTEKWFLVGKHKKKLCLYEAKDSRIEDDHMSNNNTQTQNKTVEQGVDKVSENPFAHLFVPQTETDALEKLSSLHKDLQSRIDALQNPEEIGRFFQYKDFGMCFQVIRDAQGKYADNHEGEAIEKRANWSRLWAMALSKNCKRAMALNDCRKTALHLVYKACNVCTGKNWNLPASAIDDNIVESALPRRYVRPILLRCIPMDRASCLYNMRNDTNDKIGLGWYSTGQEEAYQALHHTPLTLNDNQPAINKRLKWLQWNFFSDDEMIQHFLEIQAPDHLLK